MIIETKYNTIDEFLCQFSGVQILSVEFEYDFARYTIQFRDWIEENYFKKRFEEYTNKMNHLNKCFNIPSNTTKQSTIHEYKPIKKDSNIYRQIQKLVEDLNNDTFM